MKTWRDDIDTHVTTEVLLQKQQTKQAMILNSEKTISQINHEINYSRDPVNHSSCVTAVRRQELEAVC